MNNTVTKKKCNFTVNRFILALRNTRLLLELHNVTNFVINRGRNVTVGWLRLHKYYYIIFLRLKKIWKEFETSIEYFGIFSDFIPSRLFYHHSFFSIRINFYQILNISRNSHVHNPFDSPIFNLQRLKTRVQNDH